MYIPARLDKSEFLSKTSLFPIPVRLSSPYKRFQASWALFPREGRFTLTLLVSGALTSFDVSTEIENILSYSSKGFNISTQGL